jgi:hypothetical protein
MIYIVKYFQNFCKSLSHANSIFSNNIGFSRDNTTYTLTYQPAASFAAGCSYEHQNLWMFRKESNWECTDFSLINRWYSHWEWSIKLILMTTTLSGVPHSRFKYFESGKSIPTTKRGSSISWALNQTAFPKMDATGLQYWTHGYRCVFKSQLWSCWPVAHSTLRHPISAHLFPSGDHNSLYSLGW